KKIGPLDSADQPEFLALLKDEQPSLRAAGALGLGMIGPDAKDAVPALDKVLGDADSLVRVSAAQALGQILKDEAKGIAPVLVRGVSDTPKAVRVRAAAAIGILGITEPEAIDALATALEDRGADGDVRLQVVFTLGKLGPPAKKTGGQLLAALHDGEVRVRLAAAQALWGLTKQTQGVSVLAQLLKHKEADTRVTAADALRQIGRGAKEAAPALADTLFESDAGVRSRAADALLAIGPEARAALPALGKALHHADPGIRTLAAYALSGLGEEARPL